MKTERKIETGSNLGIVLMCLMFVVGVPLIIVASH